MSTDRLRAISVFEHLFVDGVGDDATEFVPLPTTIGTALHEKYKYNVHDRFERVVTRPVAADDGTGRVRHRLDVIRVDSWALLRASIADFRQAEWCPNRPQYALASEPLVEEVKDELLDRGFVLEGED